jgi:hypothetical protein
VPSAQTTMQRSCVSTRNWRLRWARKNAQSVPSGSTKETITIKWPDAVEGESLEPCISERIVFDYFLDFGSLQNRSRQFTREVESARVPNVSSTNASGTLILGSVWASNLRCRNLSRHIVRFLDVHSRSGSPNFKAGTPIALSKRPSD